MGRLGCYPEPPEPRFWANVDKNGPDGCWLWQGSTINIGYGVLSIVGKSVRVHRYAYELLVGPIPDGMHIDHICHTGKCTLLKRECYHRRCVNPEHLKAVTPRENIVRSNVERPKRTECYKGHPWTDENTLITPHGRRCLTCRRTSQSRAIENRKQRKKEI